MTAKLNGGSYFRRAGAAVICGGNLLSREVDVKRVISDLTHFLDSATAPWHEKLCQI